MPDPTLLDQLREKRTALLDEIAPSIEGREQEREDFSKREKELVADATSAMARVAETEFKDKDNGQTAEEQRKAAVAEIDKPLVEARAAFRSAEAAFEASFTERDAEIKKLEQRISEQEVLEFRKENAARASAASPSLSIGNEEKTYRRLEGSDKGVSYFRDLAHADSRIQGSGLVSGDRTEAEARLRRHTEELDVELPKRAEERQRRAASQIDGAEREFRGSVAGLRRGGLEANPFEQRVNPNRTDGQGGFLQVAAA